MAPKAGLPWCLIPANWKYYGKRSTKGSSTMHLSDVIYSDNETRLEEELSENLSTLAKDVMWYFDPSKSNAEKRVAGVKGYKAFVGCISRYKHCGLSEENEVRVVCLPAIVNESSKEYAQTNSATLKPEEERKFRDKHGQLVPYIELFGLLGIDLPIKRIIVPCGCFARYAQKYGN